MRITLVTPAASTGPSSPPGGTHRVDVDVPEGAQLGELRPHLARLTGENAWSTPGTRISVDHVAVDDDHPCGQPPLLPGARLLLGRGERPADITALDAHRHLAVVAGPDCGALVALDARVVVGRRSVPHAHAAAPRRSLTLRDPEMSARHIELAPRRRGVVVRDLGSTNGTVLHRARRGRAAPDVTRPDPRSPAWTTGLVRRRLAGRAVGARWTSARPGDRLVLGASVLEIRPRARDGVPPSLDPAMPRPADTSGTPLGATATMWLVPAAGSAALAMSTGNPVLLVCALLGPLVAVGLVVVERRRSTRARRAPMADRQDDARSTRPGSSRDEHGTLQDPRAPRTGDTIAAPNKGHRTGDHLTGRLGPADLVTTSIGVLRHGSSDAWCGAPTTADGSVAVVGRREHTLGAARALVLGLVGPVGAAPLVVRCDDDTAPDWGWAVWLAGRSAPLPGPHDTPTVVIVDDRHATSEIARWWHSAGGAHSLVLVAGTRGQVPAWCDAVLEVGPGTAVVHRADRTRPVVLRGVEVDWAERQARRVAGARHVTRRARVRDGAPPGTLSTAPTRVSLGDLPGVPPPDAATVAAVWRAGGGIGLRAVIGADATGAVAIDLVRDGPHALVAGTTGAGKSALLQGLVLSLALVHPPTRLAIALVDYKGGASFGPCTDLPHVVGQVTDLDARLASRALAGLRAELQSRERTLAAAGFSDLAALWQAHDTGVVGLTPPPRLLVVVDEFRAMADDLPDLVPGLLRMAAQGRSLGVHLVLATQRPAGAVSADMRANISLRIALRVTDATESIDVVDVPDAAAIPLTTPGRAVLRRGSSPPELIQVAQIVRPGATHAVHLAPPWHSSVTGWVPPPTSGPPNPHGASGPDDVRAYVDAVLDAARDLPRPAPPWLPELPEKVTTEELDELDLRWPTRPEPETTGTRRICWALADVPDDQRREVLRWDPGEGHLLVLGGAASGRTTTLRTLALGALARGLHVHLVGLELAAPDLPRALEPHTGLGTVVDAHDPRRLARLMTLLARSTPADAPQLVVIDDLEATLEALGGVARGAGADLLVDLLRDGTARGVTVVAGARATASVMAHAPLFRDRVVHALGDGVADVLAGVPAQLAGGRHRPGRAVHLRGGVARECQVAVGAPAGCAQPVDPMPAGPPPGPAAPAPRRLLPVPARVDAELLDDRTENSPVTAADADTVPVGRGGDDAGPVLLRVESGSLVVGPPGSGRSTALTVVATGLVRAGHAVVVSSSGPPWLVPGARWVHHDDLVDALEALPRLPQRTADLHVVIDDLDELEQVRPLDAEHIALLVAARRAPGSSSPTSRATVRLHASARTSRAATAYREPLARLRAARRGIVLDPFEPGSAEVFGRPLDWVMDPRHPHVVGRGAVQDGPDAVPVQIAALSNGPPTWT